MSAGSICLVLGISLCLTLAVEAVFAAAAKKPPRDILLTLLVNVVTNPVVNAVHMFLTIGFGLPSVPVTAMLEVLAVLTEALFFRLCAVGVRRPLLFSLCANALSFGTGLVFNAIF